MKCIAVYFMWHCIVIVLCKLRMVNVQPDRIVANVLSMCKLFSCFCLVVHEIYVNFEP